MLYLDGYIMRDLYFIRHGQSEANVDSRLYYSKPDEEIELTKIGRQQALQCGQSLAESLGDSPEIYFSPFRRAYDTANIIAKQFRWATLEENDLLKERTWGYLREIVDGGYKTESHFKFFYRPFGGESFSDAYTRAVKFLSNLRKKKGDSPIIIVSHNEWIRVALLYTNQISLSDFNSQPRRVGNCEIIKTQL
jgi:broad specificity phosphatase PhoE